jgi:hypothetical protein
MTMDTTPVYDQLPTAAAMGGRSGALPGACKRTNSPIARIEAAQECLLLLQLQVEQELHQFQAEQLQQQLQRLAATQTCHASSAAADVAAVSAVSGFDPPFCVSSAAIPTTYAAPLQCGADSYGSVGGGGCLQPGMRQAAGVSAAAAAAFFGSSSSSGMLPSIPRSSFNSCVLPTLGCASSAATLPSSYSAPLPAGNCGSSRYGNALSPVDSCGATFFDAVVSPSLAACPTGALSRPAEWGGAGSGNAGSPSVSPRAAAKLQELMAAQALQLEIQQELLQLLSAGPGRLK